MLDLQRLPGWRSRLYASIEAHRRYPFQFGSHDCCILCADGVLAMTGVDVAAPFRGRYDDAASALRRLREAGYDDQVALAADNFAEVHIAQARVGDLAAVPNDESWAMALGIVTGAVITIFAPDGIGSVPLVAGPNEVRRAFKVG
jgi:hypothetical protein